MRPAVLAVAGALTLGLAGCPNGGTSTAPAAPVPSDDPRDAERLAAEACERVLGDVVDAIRADRPAPEVLDELDVAAALARAAADRDATWVPLSGGVGALRAALEDDDPRAARVAVDVLVTNCPDQRQGSSKNGTGADG